jgi:hypothetical protein
MTPTSTNIKMLKEAGYNDLPPIFDKYLKLVEFVKELSQRKSRTGWYECRCNDDLSYESGELLKSIGEI